ncbi:MAG: DUF1844 domain-containing protein [Myxococcales bacterium]|nr:DUF1844 domain-containing protein [Myxococcota bacterium]MDW8281250.1 DUF1844 domain-containing protein [Myxococcales bacterium]
MDPSDSATQETQEIDFSSFIVSLATSALMHLGEIQAEGQPPQVNFALAKQTIDIIGMLRDKTRGNLTEAETQMVEDVLYDLRIKYLAARKNTS